MTDRAIRFLDRYRKPIAIIAGIWFWASCAIYAGFLRLPELPGWASVALFWSGAATNAIWYGFVLPHIDARRKRLEAKTQA